MGAGRHSESPGERASNGRRLGPRTETWPSWPPMGPLRPMPKIMVGAAGRRALVADWLPSDFPRAELVQPEQVVFSAADGLMIHGQLFLPEDLSPGEKRPAVIFFHGGSRRQMLLGFHHSGYYHNAYSLNQYLANKGYVVLTVNYRSGIGYGLDFREALNYGATGASEYNDVVGAGAYLRSRADVDPARIGLWGGSYGGISLPWGWPGPRICSPPGWTSMGSMTGTWLSTDSGPTTTRASGRISRSWLSNLHQWRTWIPGGPRFC